MTDHETLMAQLDRLHVSINETVAERNALLTALRDLVAVIDQRSKVPGADLNGRLHGLAAARAAIAKAEGETS